MAFLSRQAICLKPARPTPTCAIFGSSCEVESSA
jgi:hypothetical protein